MSDEKILEKEKDVRSEAAPADFIASERDEIPAGFLRRSNDMLEEIIESSIETKGDKIEATPLAGGDTMVISEDDLVSMNMIVFPANFFEYIEDNFDEFLRTSDLAKAEYLIPDVVSKALKEGYCKVYVENTDAKWVGVTYKEDKDSVQNYINELIDNKVYKSDLWS